MPMDNGAQNIPFLVLKTKEEAWIKMVTELNVALRTPSYYTLVRSPPPSPPLTPSQPNLKQL
jgi:hypothetical protein